MELTAKQEDKTADRKQTMSLDFPKVSAIKEIIKNTANCFLFQF